MLESSASLGVLSKEMQHWQSLLKYKKIKRKRVVNFAWTCKLAPSSLDEL